MRLPLIKCIYCEKLIEINEETLHCWKRHWYPFYVEEYVSTQKWNPSSKFGYWDRKDENILRSWDR